MDIVSTVNRIAATTKWEFVIGVRSNQITLFHAAPSGGLEPVLTTKDLHALAGFTESLDWQPQPDPTATTITLVDLTDLPDVVHTSTTHEQPGVTCDPSELICAGCGGAGCASCAGTGSVPSSVIVAMVHHDSIAVDFAQGNDMLVRTNTCTRHPECRTYRVAPGRSVALCATQLGVTRRTHTVSWGPRRVGWEPATVSEHLGCDRSGPVENPDVAMRRVLSDPASPNGVFEDLGVELDDRGRATSWQFSAHRRQDPDDALTQLVRRLGRVFISPASLSLLTDGWKVSHPDQGVEPFTGWDLAEVLSAAADVWAPSAKTV